MPLGVISKYKPPLSARRCFLSLGFEPLIHNVLSAVVHIPYGLHGLGGGILNTDISKYP